MDHTPADHTLLTRARHGEPAAFATLYDRHHRHAFRTALRICRNHEAAEDVLQQAFLEVWHQADRFDPGRGSVGGWITTVVRCRAVDSMRRQDVPGRRVAEAGRTIEAGSPDPVDSVTDRDQAASVRRAIGLLPEKQQAVLMLSYRAELTQCEIAAKLDVPLGTVKSRVRLGLDALRGAPEISALRG